MIGVRKYVKGERVRWHHPTHSLSMHEAEVIEVHSSPFLEYDIRFENGVVMPCFGAELTFVSSNNKLN